MRAVQQHQAGGADQLYIGTVAKPAPRSGEVLVRVAVAALNRADILQREGKYPPPAGASAVLGLELAGTIDAVGAGVTSWKSGDRVLALVPGGAQAEYALVHHDMLIAMPDGLSFEQCAAIPEVFLTAFQSLVWLADTRPGEKVLLHAGGSGVGTAAIQLVKMLGAEPFVSASPAKHALCLELGAAAAFDYRSDGFWQQLKERTGGVEVIVDPVGGDYFAENLKLLKPDGRLVMLAVMGGAKTSDVNIGQIVFKRLQIVGSTLRSRPRSYQARLTHEFWAYAGQAFVSGQLKPVIDSVFDFEKIAEAHTYLESNASAGKVLLKIA